LTHEHFICTNVQVLFGRKVHAATAAEGRRRVILEAAVRVIGAGGPDAITHRRVAAMARVPLGSLTYYFESRDELVREAFRFYIAEASALLNEVQREFRPRTAAELVEVLLEVTRREFMEPAAIRAEYEMILYAARDQAVAREFLAWERSLEARAAAMLEPLGAPRPFDGGRTLVDLVRGFELERLAGREGGEQDLRRRLGAVVAGLIAPAANSSNHSRRRAANRARPHPGQIRKRRKIP
jgi:TetR/AcrR family transcriptional regulator, regulator of biofilm formation and stress response